MVLLFFETCAVIVVVLNIPLALLGSTLALYLTGNTLNIMTLGGLALAIGILVDEATVEIENIHTQMEHTPSMSRAVRQGNMETAVPRLLALLCILSVFIPSYIMQGPVRSLFVPLSLAVGASMVTSYLLSSTLVPVLSIWLLENRHGTSNHDGGSEAKPGLFAKLQSHFESLVTWTIAHRRLIVLTYLFSACAIVIGVGSILGRELFPRVDAGQFQLRVRPSQGTNFELTRQVAQKTLDAIGEVAGAIMSRPRWGMSEPIRPSSRSTPLISGVVDPTIACSEWACGPAARSASSNCKKGSAPNCQSGWENGTRPSSSGSG